MDVKKSSIPAGSFMMLLLFVAVLCSAMAVIYNAHQNRQLLNELYTNVAVYNKAKADWGRLILEQSAWTSYSRVETIAIEQLNMRSPAPNEVRVITR